jgi:alpha-aminoadipate carrier protein LysW
VLTGGSRPTGAAGFRLFASDKEKTMSENLCIECAATVALPGDVMQNEIVQCAECGVELEVLAVAPVELALAPEVEEDWGE